MRVQLVGPMTGIDGFNYGAFNEAAERLRAAGHDVFSPAESYGGDQSYPRSAYMRASLAALLHAEVVVLLPGWETSPGSKTEMRTALALEIPVVPLEAFQTGTAALTFV